MALAGLVAGAAGLQSGAATLRPSAPEVVNTDRPGINAHNSPAVAADAPAPSVIALADRIDTPRFSCSVSFSRSGGGTWTQLALPLPADAPNCHQPDVAYLRGEGPAEEGGGRAQLLVLYTATAGRHNQPVGVWLQRYDGETPAGPAVRVAPAEAFHARMAVDGRRVWVTWVQADGAADKDLGFTDPAPVRLARSDDGGATFSAPVVVSEPGRRAVQPTPLWLGGDRVVVGALDLVDDVATYEATQGGIGGAPPDRPWRVVAWSSTDAGGRFGPAATVADVVAPERIIVNLAPAPSFAVDPAAEGRIYAAWDGGRGDAREVYVARSEDAGATWGPPVTVAPRPRSQSLPALGVSPEGRVDVLFYDRGADPADRMAEVTLASSHDGGATFRTATLSHAPFDTTIGFGGPQGFPALGSQLAVLSTSDRTLAFWSDTTGATPDNNAQDLAVALVDVEEEGRRRPALMLLGLLLLGLGGGLGLVARLRPGDRRPQQA